MRRKNKRKGAKERRARWGKVGGKWKRGMGKKREDREGKVEVKKEEKDEGEEVNRDTMRVKLTTWYLTALLQYYRKQSSTNETALFIPFSLFVILFCFIVTVQLLSLHVIL